MSGKLSLAFVVAINRGIALHCIVLSLAVWGLHRGSLFRCVKLFGAQRWFVGAAQSVAKPQGNCRYDGRVMWGWSAFKWLRKGPVAGRRHRYRDLDSVNRNLLNSLPTVSCMELMA